MEVAEKYLISIVLTTIFGVEAVGGSKKSKAQSICFAPVIHLVPANVGDWPDLMLSRPVLPVLTWHFGE